VIAYIVVEGPADADWLRGALPPESLEDVAIVPGGGLSGATSMARTLLVTRRKPLALVFDANAEHPEVVGERFQSVQEIVGMVAGRVPFRVVMAVPSLEALWAPGADSRRASFLGELEDFLQQAREYASHSAAFAG
jgi:hypothetical protein